MNNTSFENELKKLINRYSRENESNTPDFILAQYIMGCLDNYSKIIKRRDNWYGIVLDQKKQIHHNGWRMK